MESCLKEYTIKYHFLDKKDQLAYIVARNTEDMEKQMYPFHVDSFTCKLARNYE